LQSETQPASTFKVRFGEWDTQTTKERWPYQERLVNSIISHPQYSSKSLANDVALLVLERPIDPASHINVVCLPPPNFVADSPDCFANGWGRNEFGSNNLLSSILKKVPLGMVESNTCQSLLRSTRLGNRFQLHPSFVCAGGVKGIDTCTGDGGAPLVCPVGPQEDYRYVQVGSVAWGIGCKDNVPGVYSNIASFRSWIDTVMTNLGLGTSSYTY
jgi:plasma kallikrein